MEARYRLVRVAFWLRNWWRKQTMGGLFGLNVPYWVALLCDAMVRAGAAWTSLEQGNGLQENVMGAKELISRIAGCCESAGFEQRQG